MPRTRSGANDFVNKKMKKLKLNMKLRKKNSEIINPGVLIVTSLVRENPFLMEILNSEYRRSGKKLHINAMPLIKNSNVYEI
jgi:hypothetical protein